MYKMSLLWYIFLLFSLQVYLFAEALAEGAVKMGMPSALAHSIASQTVLVSLTVCVLLFHCGNISNFSIAYCWLSHFMHVLIWFLFCCRVLGGCYVTPGSIQLSSALRSAPQVGQPSTGFTPWSRVVWGRRPWAPWNLPQREPGNSAESLQQDAGNDGCCLPLNNLSGPYWSRTTNWIFVSINHCGTQRQKRTCHFIFSLVISFRQVLFTLRPFMSLTRRIYCE